MLTTYHISHQQEKSIEPKLKQLTLRINCFFSVQLNFIVGKIKFVF